MKEFLIKKQKESGTCSIRFFKEDTVYPGVHKIADKVRRDIERVIDVCPEESSVLSELGKYAVIYGTVGKSPILNTLQKNGKLNLSMIKGKWEVYGFGLVEDPFPGVECALVIAGSDKRGTIYGLFHLSELLGVSPLVDWSDVRPKKQEQVLLTEQINMLSKIPSVKYRGFFINDEWPAFGTWANHHFGGFNAEMYDHVFELLLRLKGNYLWPAMWASCLSCDGPGLKNAELADEYGIVMGTSHHEPCIRHGEEYRNVRGKDSVYGDAWNFQTNKAGITRFWEDGLKRSGKFENIITIGMRGEADTAILGREATLADNINLLRDVIETQNRLIAENVNADLTQVPRLFVLFTEVEAFFYGEETAPGLKDNPLLDGVTLMLCDDNFGNIRSLPTEEMRRHKGGYGLYYHLDFHGGAYAYDWMNTNYLPKMWEQLTTAYDYGIRDVWVANIGDISLLEHPLSYFLDLAYDMESMGTSALNQTEEYTRHWITKQFDGVFSNADKEAIKEIIDGYNKINHNRKPEIMNIDVYHPVHFNEAKDLISQAEHITALAEELKLRCPEDALPSFYELVYFPAVASMNLHRMWILATWNDFYARQGRIEANDLAEEISRCIRRDRELTEEFHKIDDGKWFGMGLSEHIGFTNWCEEDCKYPRMTRIEPANKPRLIVATSDTTKYTLGMPWSGRNLKITNFLQQDIDEIEIELACGSTVPISYVAITNCPWLRLSANSGLVKKKEILILHVDRNKLKGRKTGEALIKTSFSQVTLEVEAQNVETAELKPMTFLEANGYIAMEAEHYFLNKDIKGIGFHKLNHYGRTISAMKVLPPLQSDFTLDKERPYLEYCFMAEQEGKYKIDFYLSPSNPPYLDKKLFFGFQINGGEQVIENVVGSDFTFLCNEWVSAVRNNIRIYHSSVACNKGENHLRIYAVSPSLVIEKIVLYPEGSKLPESYLGPKESYYVK